MTCPHLVEDQDLPLQRNALRVEICTPSPRCLLKLPEHWSEGAKRAGGLRWIGSGGSALVFGPCTPGMCPKAALRTTGGKREGSGRKEVSPLFKKEQAKARMSRWVLDQLDQRRADGRRGELIEAAVVKIYGLKAPVEGVNMEDMK